MAKRRRRNQSQKEPVGRTKSEILLFIANKPKVSLTDIRSYLRTEMNIRNPKVVRDHVSDLIQLNLIQRVKAERGLSDIYFIEESFSAFRNAFNYLSTNYEPVNLLKSPYYEKLKSNEDFFLFGLVNTAHIILVDTFELMGDEVRFSQLLSENSKEYLNSSVIDQIKETREKLLTIDYMPLIQSIKNSSPEELLSYFGEDFGTDFRGFVHTLIELLFPERQKQKIINIISSSPSAMDYFLNLKNENKMMFLLVLLRFFMGGLFIDQSKIQAIESFNKLAIESFNKLKPEDMSQEALSFMNDIVNQKNIINDNPILTTLKAHFIIDAVNNKIIENEYSTKTLTDILIPKVKQ